MRRATIREYRGRSFLVHELFAFALSANISPVYDLIKVDRKPIDENPLEGFLLGQTKDLLLLNLVNTDVVCLNGYSVIGRRDVRKLKIQRKDAFLVRALRLKNLSPSMPLGISIASWPDLLESVTRKFPLFTIHQERLDSTVCYVGRLATKSNRTFGLKEIDPDARWSRSRSYKFKDLTKVDFGGGYEAALARLAVASVKRRKARVVSLAISTSRRSAAIDATTVAPPRKRPTRATPSRRRDDVR